MAENKGKRRGFGWKEKLDHYTGVANGTVPTKAESKFSDAEQKAYARGQRDARNEQRVITRWKHSSEQEREDWKVQKAVDRAERRYQKAVENAQKHNKSKKAKGGK